MNIQKQEEQSLKKVWNKCIYFLLNKHKSRIFLLMLIIIIAGSIPSVNSLFLQNITDQIELYSDQAISKIDLPSLLFKWVIVYALWWEALNLLWRSHDYLYLKTIPLVKADVVAEFYDYTLYHEHKFFQEQLAGSISNRIIEASNSLEMIFHYATEKMLHQFSILLFALITLYTVHHHIAAIFLIWIVIFIGISLYFAKTANHYSILYGKDKSLAAGKIVDSISNISVIHMFSSYKHENQYLKTYLNKSVRSDQTMQWFMLKMRYGLGLSCSLMLAAMVYYIIVLRGNLEISVGQSVLIITLCITVVNNMWDVTQAFGDLFEQVGLFSQSMSLLKKYQIQKDKNIDALNVRSPSIEFRNVTFKYRNNDNKFKNKSIIIPAYEKVGLIGFSGSGKSTFAGMISRLYELEEGSILIDGQDINTISQNSLRQNISIIPQEPILFHRSILENIRYSDMDASDEEIYKASKAAHIHDFIISLPNGYDTICGERGSSFSGGQRQRIAMARAFLKKAPILILDEATSALDTHTEKLIQESLDLLMQNKTVLVITHKLSTLLHMDRILVFDKGQIVEDGTHAELRTNGEIYKML